MKKENQNFNVFKDHAEAIEKANIDAPATLETLHKVKEMHNYPIKTKDDFRFFVLMNHIRSIDAKLNKSKESTYLRRIQDNILLACERFLP